MSATILFDHVEYPATFDDPTQTFDGIGVVRDRRRRPRVDELRREGYIPRARERYMMPQVGRRG